jgi:hypothetical protein
LKRKFNNKKSLFYDKPSQRLRRCQQQSEGISMLSYELLQQQLPLQGIQFEYFATAKMYVYFVICNQGLARARQNYKNKSQNYAKQE